jgi:hypothetical protein
VVVASQEGQWRTGPQRDLSCRTAQPLDLIQESLCHNKFESKLRNSSMPESSISLYVMNQPNFESKLPANYNCEKSHPTALCLNLSHAFIVARFQRPSGKPLVTSPPSY